MGRIEKLEVDPLWDDIEQTRSRQEGQALAEELRTALKDQPGVSIERVPLHTIRR